MREIKANELDRVSKRHEVVINKICDLYFNSHSNINQLRKELTQLSIYGDQFSRIGRKSKEYSENILNKLNDIEDNRSKLLSSTDSPQWEIKHHFHILSFEHFRGNTQPHLMEIAEVLPKRLEIAAIAHNSVRHNDLLLNKFYKAKNETELLGKKLSQIDKRRGLTQAHLKVKLFFLVFFINVP